ncbi:MAG: PHP domain-containing protein [Lachnospiraceae bacterium]|nr:PHP domain-containing protein [Lachnospiraceae bacterium]
MFDFHMHSWVSEDCRTDPKLMVAAAEAVGLREICFTDHMDAKISGPEKSIYTQEDYDKNYASLRSSTVKLRFGMEFGMTPDNYPRFVEETAKREYDSLTEFYDEDSEK